MSAKPKPEGTSDADWAARKNLIIGLAHFMSGKQYSNDARNAQADAELLEFTKRVLRQRLLQRVDADVAAVTQHETGTEKREPDHQVPRRLLDPEQ